MISAGMPPADAGGCFDIALFPIYSRNVHKAFIKLTVKSCIINMNIYNI